MNSPGLRITQFVSHLLEREDREAVLGDLLESGESAAQFIFGILGLVIRRQFAHWKSWRPWLAAFGLALPGSLLLMGLSVSVSSAYVHYLSADSGSFSLIEQLLLLLGCSWSAGFAVARLSRRTLSLSIVTSCIPCLFCFSTFRIVSLSPLCLVLFLPPAVWGVCSGLTTHSLNRIVVIILAVVLTLLTVPSWQNPHSLLLAFSLVWPAWYIVTSPRRNPLQPSASQS